MEPKQVVSLTEFIFYDMSVMATKGWFHYP